MSNSLLKPSGWYLRPLHLVKPDGGIDSENVPREIVTSPPKSLSPEEEFYIRKCCPVTLNHLLPDLSLTKNYNVEELNEEFDSNLLLKLEKHLEESHRDVSCDSSTGNEEETEDSNLDGCIENDINMHILQNVKPEPTNKKLLMPHKVNYPDSISMGDLSLPGVVLNNKFPLQSDGNIFSSPYQRAKIVPKISSEMINFQFSSEEIQRLLLPKKNNKRIPSLQGDKELSYSKTRKSRKFGGDILNERQNSSIAAQSAPVPRIEIDSSFADSRSRRDAFELPPTLSPLRQQHYNNPSHSSPSLCVNHRSRSRSLSPFKASMHSMHSRSQALAGFSDDLIMPSPHLIELARLKREELKLEEKILLRQRTMLEAERLKPPADRWYEMKDCRFHQENHRHNTYLKNERILPLIHERRRLLIDTLKNSDY